MICLSARTLRAQPQPCCLWERSRLKFLGQAPLIQSKQKRKKVVNKRVTCLLIDWHRSVTKQNMGVLKDETSMWISDKKPLVSHVSISVDTFMAPIWREGEGTRPAIHVRDSFSLLKSFGKWKKPIPVKTTKLNATTPEQLTKLHALAILRFQPNNYWKFK